MTFGAALAFLSTWGLTQCVGLASVKRTEFAERIVALRLAMEPHR